LTAAQREGMNTTLTDPNLTSMRKDIAAFDERIREISLVLGSLDPRILKKIFETTEILKETTNQNYFCEDEKSRQFLKEELKNHIELIEELRKRETNWHELQNAQSHRAKMVEVENKRTSSEQTQIPVERVAGLVKSISIATASQIREGADKIVEDYFKWPEEHKTKRVMLRELIIQRIEMEIMEEVRPIITMFFPKPSEIQPTDMNAVAAKEERILKYKEGTQLKRDIRLGKKDKDGNPIIVIKSSRNQDEENEDIEMNEENEENENLDAEVIDAEIVSSLPAIVIPEITPFNDPFTDEP
jgi:hypothetical protein